MMWLLLPVALQIACVVHAIRNGRNQMWIMAIVFLPVAGSLAYLAIEVLPGLGGNRHVRTARSQVMAKLDPERDLRAARDAMEVADTAANRIHLADALVGLDRTGEAVPLYREALAMAPVVDVPTSFKLAKALFTGDRSDEALTMLEGMPEGASASERDRRALLRAQILAHLGRNDEALALYRDIVTRLPGEEARCRYAALLLETGDKAGARKLLEEVEVRMKRLDRTQRVADAEMYAWATRELASMRG